MRRSNVSWCIAACAALALAACGFAGEPPFDGRRTPDVAPWQDQGLVTFCDGAERIAAPTAKAAGFCVVQAGAAKACTSDGDCASRERCTCGGCQIAYCSTGGECGGTDSCSFADARCDRSCSQDADCAPGEVCPPGQDVCRGKCAGDGDCQRGERCDAGRCAATPCATDGDCAGSGTCVLQRVPAALREPSPIVDGSDVTMWIERQDGAGPSAIWRATSSDGRRFTFAPRAPVVSPDASDAGRAGAPTVWRMPTGGLLLAYASGAGLVRGATSDDGMTFTVAASPLLAPSAAWERSGLDAPSLVGDPAGDAILLYYGTVDRTAVGLARGDLQLVFTAGKDPVLVPSQVKDEELWRDIDRIASPFAEAAVAPDGKPFVRVWFAARGRESAASVQFGMTVPEPPNFSIGEAASLDGTGLVPWPFDPAFDRVESFLTHLSERSPAVAAVGSTRLLYYVGAAPDESKATNVGVALSPPGD